MRQSLDATPHHANFIMDSAPLVEKHIKMLDGAEAGVKAANNARLSLNDFDRAFLANMYNNIDTELNRFARGKGFINDERTYSEKVGPYKKHAFNIITALYTTFDLRDLISWQPMSQKIGAIYRTVYEYGSDKGSISAGDTMFSSTTSGTRSSYYSTEIVKDEAVTFTFDTPDSVAALAYYPLHKPDDIVITVTDGAAAGEWTYLSTTSGTYNLQKDASGTTDGTIVAATGVVTLDAVNIGVGTAVATYKWNSQKFSANVPIPRVSVSVTEDLVTAERRNLLVDMMLDVSYDYEKQFGQTLNAEMQSTIVQYLQNEMSFRILGEMYDEATGNQGSTYTFYETPADGVTLSGNAQEFYKLLAQMAQKSRSNVGRGFANKLIVGDNTLAYLKVLPAGNFTRAAAPDGDGPYYAGNLNGDYDVYYNPEMLASKFMVTYKGKSWWEAPYYVGSYLPLMNSQYMLYPDFHAEQGFLAMESYKHEYPLLTVKGSIDPGKKGVAASESVG